jgi:hypothetical protein
MAAKKSRKKRRQSANKKERALRAHAQHVTARLGTEAVMRIEPKGQSKMSAVLEEFVEPYLSLADTDSGKRVLYHLAATAWNAALLPEQEREAMIDEFLAKTKDVFPKGGHKDIRELLLAMVERKLALFEDNKRFIVSIELTGPAEGGYLSVASLVPQSE